jgi:hypothetical protein
MWENERPKGLETLETEVARSSCLPRRLAFILVSLLLVLSIACDHIEDGRESEEKFASTYVAYRKALRDCEILSWVIMLDQSQAITGSNSNDPSSSYRKFFVGALGTKTSAQKRSDFARKAIKEHDSRNRIDEFETRCSALDNASLAMVEAANRIRNDSHRQQAVAIAESARKIEYDLNALRESYLDTYIWQMELLNAIVNAGGDLNTVVHEFPEIPSKKEKLHSDQRKLRDEVQKTEQRLETQYAAFKGMTGIKLDYIEPPSDDQNSPK